MATKNITLKIDESLYQKARVCAAKKGESLSAMVRGFLERECSTDDAHRKITETLEAIYAEADDAAGSRSTPLDPLTRDEIYADRIR